MKLQNEVYEADVDEAIRLMKIATQSAATDPTTGLIDMDMLATGISAQHRQRVLDINDEIRALTKSNQGEFKKGVTLSHLRELLANKESVPINKIDEKDILSAGHMLQESNLIIMVGNKKNPIFKLGTHEE